MTTAKLRSEQRQTCVDQIVVGSLSFINNLQFRDSLCSYEVLQIELLRVRIGFHTSFGDLPLVDEILVRLIRPLHHVAHQTKFAQLGCKACLLIVVHRGRFCDSIGGSRQSGINRFDFLLQVIKHSTRTAPRTNTNCDVPNNHRNGANGSGVAPCITNCSREEIAFVSEFFKEQMHTTVCKCVELVDVKCNLISQQIGVDP
mmetsp:Transcript_57365/g.65729  ORF Transcript_57365/g.65729 Transcript_57365/m.65729 type:complete len:201 (-) Transcript_57365:564-1166(-)